MSVKKPDFKKGEQIFLLNIDVGEDAPFVEAVVVAKDVTEKDIKKGIEAFQETEAYAERESDDAIIDSLIDQDLVISVLEYSPIWC